MRGLVRVGKYGGISGSEREDIRRALKRDGNHPKELKKVKEAQKKDK